MEEPVVEVEEPVVEVGEPEPEEVHRAEEEVQGRRRRNENRGSMSFLTKEGVCFTPVLRQELLMSLVSPSM